MKKVNKYIFGRKYVRKKHFVSDVRSGDSDVTAERSVTALNKRNCVVELSHCSKVASAGRHWLTQNVTVNTNRRRMFSSSARLKCKQHTRTPIIGLERSSSKAGAALAWLRCPLLLGASADSSSAHRR